MDDTGPARRCRIFPVDGVRMDERGLAREETCDGVGMIREEGSKNTSVECMGDVAGIKKTRES